MVLLNSILLQAAIDRCKGGTLDEAILLATLGHYGQRDRGGSPYILHASAVMVRVAPYGTATQIAGILHDLVEDSPFFTYDILRQCGFSEVVVEALTYLYRPNGVTILEAAQKLAALPIENPAVLMAMRVKVADYHENSNILRIPEPKQADIELKLRYLAALQIVSKALSKEK